MSTHSGLDPDGGMLAPCVTPMRLPVVGARRRRAARLGVRCVRQAVAATAGDVPSVRVDRRRRRARPATGALYSWSVIHLAVDPVFAAETPYVVGLVELADGTRLYGRIVGVDHDDLRDGLELQVGDHSRPGPADLVLHGAGGVVTRS